MAMDPETQVALKQLAHEASALLSAARESLRPATTSAKFWPRAKDVAVILIPFVLGVSGYFVNLTLQSRETRARLIQLAIDILKAEPTGAEDNQRVRAWAVDVIARNSDVPIPPATRQDLETTSALALGGIIGTDDRARVDDTMRLPWAAVCHLSILRNDGTQWVATGVLIAPTAVLTVDYVVFPSDDNRSSASEITIIPGRNGNSEPFGRAISRTFHRVGSSDADGEGLALITFAAPARARQWMPIAIGVAQLTPSDRLTLAGYPGDRESGRLFRSEGNVVRADRDLVYYDMDTAGGMSGSPVWRSDDRSFMLAAVHAGSTGEGKHGVRITEDVAIALKRLVPLTH